MKIRINKFIIIASVILGMTPISTPWYLLAKNFLKDNTLDGDGMVNDRCLSCTYHFGGGMERDSVSITVKETDNETAALEVVSCSSPDYEEITENYTVSFDSLEKIYQIYNKYEIAKWGELPASEFKVLDDPIVSVCIKTANTTVSFDSTKEFPKNAGTIISEIHSALYDCIEQAKSSEQPGTAE